MQDASTPLPCIHCYMFSNQKDPIADSISVCIGPILDG